MGRNSVDRRFLLAGLGGAVVGSLFSRTARAGELTPPPGPITPTGRPLTELYDRIARTTVGVAEPRIPVQSLPGSPTACHVISASGSYYLTQNLAGAPGKNGIEVLADDVDIDLCGFHAVGPMGSLFGITSERQNLTVYDGSLIGWDTGVELERASRFILFDVVSIGALKGAFLFGNCGQVYDCDAHSTDIGFFARGERTLVEDCATWTCRLGFACTGSRNFFVCNCATDSGPGFDIGPGNAFGPIVDVSGVGDISLIANSDHPAANFIH
jgi:hypothetical protein